MPIMVKAAGWIGSIIAILALVIMLLKQIIGFIGFLTAIIKIGIVLLFVVAFLAVGILAYKAWKSSQKARE